MKEIYEQLASAVLEMKSGEVERLAHLALKEGYPPEEAIEQGLAAGMNEVGKLFASKVYFVPEVLVCAKAMYAGFDILKEKVVSGSLSRKGSIVIGVVDGDFHDIGKNIVKLMLEAAGFRIVDLGKNVTHDRFCEAVAAEKPDIVAMSTLMSTTMDSMSDTVASLKGRFPELKLMVGGAPVDDSFSRSIGAHFYGEDARRAVEGAHDLMGIPFEG
ncbi:corrinoid protein [bacterium]|nr:corrinoid protein [bacterium]